MILYSHWLILKISSSKLRGSCNFIRLTLMSLSRLAKIQFRAYSYQPTEEIANSVVQFEPDPIIDNYEAVCYYLYKMMW